jgi:glycosyltransferase involved in cell wall biosynthesis
MVGLIPNNRTPEYFAVADVVVFPSTAESTSISCIEAMLMEKSIVASRVGGLIELLGGAEPVGRLIQLVDNEHSDYAAPSISSISAQRYSAMAKSIMGLLEDAHENRRLGIAARKRAMAHFEWTNVIAATEANYRKAMSRK